MEFIVKHYAQDVAYECEGFIEKNKDAISGNFNFFQIKIKQIKN